MPVKAPVIALTLLIMYTSVPALGGEVKPYMVSVYEEKSAEEPSSELLEFLGEWGTEGMELADHLILDSMVDPDHEGGDYENTEK